MQYDTEHYDGISLTILPTPWPPSPAKLPVGVMLRTDRGTLRQWPNYSFVQIGVRVSPLPPHSFSCTYRLHGSGGGGGGWGTGSRSGNGRLSKWEEGVVTRLCDPKLYTGTAATGHLPSTVDLEGGSEVS